METNIDQYDFFAQNEETFYNKFSHESILCQGKHRDKIPLVTILITTYKRPELLRQALLSALNQKGFEDYQIIIADNEGISIQEETPTAKVVKEYRDDKVIYYRHSEEVSLRMDSAVKLAQSPWILFLHDDDLLEENHLRIMTDVVKKHKEIKFLGCDMRSFSTKQMIIKKQNLSEKDFKICKYTRNTTCFGSWAGWLGALISRQHYISIGGMPQVNMGVGDTVFVANFLHHFGTYKYSGEALYFYRRGEQQLTYLNANDVKVRTKEYIFYKYVIRKYHKLTYKIWERNMAYLLLDKYNMYNLMYGANLDFAELISECDMPSDINQKNVRYYMTRGFFMLYREVAWRLAYIWRQKIKKSDIYLVI